MVATDFHIEIYGKIESAEAISSLATAAAREGGTSWGAPPTMNEAVERILSAGDNGEKFTLLSNGMFEEVTGVCRAHGLSYILLAGEFGDQGERHQFMRAWTPGMETPYEGDRVDPQSDLWKALGRERAGNLVKEFEDKTIQYAKDRVVEISPEAREAFTAAAPKM